MKLRYIRTLTLLQEMDTENPPTQRELAANASAPSAKYPIGPPSEVIAQIQKAYPAHRR